MAEAVEVFGMEAAASEATAMEKQGENP